MSRLPAKNSKSKGQDRAATTHSAFRAEWIGWGFWALSLCVLGVLVVSKMPGAIIPALGMGLAFALTRSGVTERLRPYHPAYCVATGMIIWLLWTMVASGNRELLIDLGLLLLGLGLVSVLPGILSASVLTMILVGYSGVVWSHRGESPPDERGVITVEVTLLLLSVVATWVGYIESQLHQARITRRRKKSSAKSNRKEILVEDQHDE